VNCKWFLLCRNDTTIRHNTKIHISHKITHYAQTRHGTPRQWPRAFIVRPLDSFPAFHGTRRFNTEFTRALRLFLFLARPIQSTSPHPTSPRSILILSTQLRLGLSSSILSSGFFTNNLYAFLFSHSCYMACPSHSPRLYYSNYT
jgi:hypothetical protein